ncbi:SDR family oxidoreductase [Saccharospirillum mangrovi]|uniref:SDR family oxidoreductase n=1 Tax=Saccharospirillum mangrovi TaxID=2161747 RepID=UPI000D367066|nr:SDR family oxidoreductase [Saccharospirillum mangrovi]
MKLTDKVAIVTGAGSGMGKAIAERFAAEGASLVLCDLHADRLADVAQQINQEAVVTIAANIADPKTADTLVETALKRFGGLDILCNNAGIMDYMQGVGELGDEVWERVIAVNLNGPMYTMRRAMAALKERQGSIINVGSTASRHGGAAGAAYTTSKHALLGLSLNTAWMYAKSGVRCNVIAPGATATHIADSMPQDRLDPTGAARAAEFSALVPAVLDPTDIANLALFLASDESKRINGAVIPADGGWDAV